MNVKWINEVLPPKIIRQLLIFYPLKLSYNFLFFTPRNYQTTSYFLPPEIIRQLLVFYPSKLSDNFLFFTPRNYQTNSCFSPYKIIRQLLVFYVYRVRRTNLIRLNSLNTKSNIWRRSFTRFTGSMRLDLGDILYVRLNLTKGALCLLYWIWKTNSGIFSRTDNSHGVIFVIKLFSLWN